MHHPVLKYMSFINMKMQRLTTVEPTPDMVEVAICAFNSMYKLEHEAVDEA
jgi:uncharacterized protein YqhQ